MQRDDGDTSYQHEIYRTPKARRPTSPVKSTFVAKLPWRRFLGISLLDGVLLF